MGNLKNDFDKNLDQFINRFGIEGAGLILKNFTKHTELKCNSSKSKEVIADYVVLQALEIFAITKDQLENGNCRWEVEARWAAVHLIKFYVGCSYTQLTNYFKRSPRALKYANRRCEALLETPRFQKDFNQKYRSMEQKLIAFIAKL